MQCRFSLEALLFSVCAQSSMEPISSGDYICFCETNNILIKKLFASQNLRNVMMHLAVLQSG